MRGLVAAAAALALACAAPPAVPAERFDAKVVSVHDGDTVTVLRGREQVKIRLACIDAPERGQAFGSRSRERLVALVADRTVTAEVIDHDEYGRTVARLFADGADICLAMVRAGLAWHYRYHCPHDAALAAAEADARAARRGLWADARPEPPWEWRKKR